LVAEIARKDQQILALQQERATLHRLLLEARKTEVAGREAVRSSSVKRIMAEEAIISRLRSNVPPETSVDQLWSAVQNVGVASQATLRSYLHRMKAQGKIESRSRGRWRLLNSEV
jgi:hypothetical protein